MGPTASGRKNATSHIGTGPLAATSSPGGLTATGAATGAASDTDSDTGAAIGAASGTATGASGTATGPQATGLGPIRARLQQWCFAACCCR